MQILKHDPEIIASVVYYDGNSQSYYLKRFTFELTDKKVSFLNDHPETRMIHLSLDHLPRLELVFEEKNGKRRENEEVNVAEFIAVKSYSAKGKRLSSHAIEEIRMLEPFPYEEPESEDTPEETETIAEEGGENGTEAEEKDEPLDEAIHKTR